MKFIKQYPKATAIVLISIIIIGMFFYRERSKVLSSTTEMKLSNESRQEEVFIDDFYSKQLTQKEKNVLVAMKAKLEALEGGIIEFEEPLTGTEYLRVVAALENENDYFYGFYEIPMSGENIYLKHTNKDLTSLKTSYIEKCILFLSSATGLNIAGQYAKDGTVENLEEVANGLARNDQDKIKIIEDKKMQISVIINNILSGIPKNAGQKDTLTYFYDWIHENIEYNNRLGIDAFKFSNMQEVIDIAYSNNNVSCVLEGKATALGFCKLLSALCNQAGMESHIVMGTWGKLGDSPIAMTVVKIGDENIYVDAAGMKVTELAGQRYLTEQEALNHLNLVNYFKY